MSTTPPTPVDPPTFALVAGAIDPAALKVTSFRGEEGISKLYRFDVDVVTVGADLDLTEEPLLGRAATLTLNDYTDKARVINGVVAKVTAIANRTHGAGRAFRIRVVPRFWLFKKRVASRVYQDRTVPEIIASLLDAPAPAADGLVMKIPARTSLSRTYPKRAYCVQYQESDYDFIKRIAAEEGIFWYFRHGADTPSTEPDDAIIFADTARAGYSTLQSSASHITEGDKRLPLLLLRDVSVAGTRGEDDDVGRFERNHEVRPTAVMISDYDPDRPLLELRMEASATLAPSDVNGALSVYDHHGEFAVPDVTEDRAKTHVEQHRRRAVVAAGDSSCRVLVPGYRYQLDATNAPHLNDEYVVVSVEHEGKVPEFFPTETVTVYSNRFECAFATTPYRPKRPKRKPVQVMESAVVAGPAKDDVYTDHLGRVRVKFHWDLASNADEHSATWLRVMQAWGGPSYGAQFIPRVGTEVMVAFLGGDQDCPVVVGSVYNAAQPLPFKVPQHQTKSGLKTQSSPGGAGFNELSFEDQAGAEQVYIHAQRDFDEEVKHDHTVTVGHSQHIDVQENQTNVVGGNHTEHVLGAADRVVGQDEKVHVKGSRAQVVSGNATTLVERERRLHVKGGDHVEVKGNATWKTGDDLTITTEGNFTTLVGKQDDQRSLTFHVEGMTQLWGRELTEISSEKGIRFRCGESIVEVMPDRIELISPNLTLRSPNARVAIGEEDVAIHAKKETTIKADTVLFNSCKASMVMKTEVKVDGSQILLNAPDVAKDPPQEEPKPPTVIELADEDGNPLPYQRYVVTMGDGSERSGFLDKDGKAELDFLDESATVTFPGLLRAASA